MGSDVLIRIRKCVVICTRVCCRSVGGHPFLIGFLCWLYCFYRYFPLLFSLVASASPVLITTALLLGTLLSYGESNLPELEEEEVSEWTRSGSEGVVVERDAEKVRRSRGFGDDDNNDGKVSVRGENTKEDDSEDEFGDDEDDDNKPLIKGTSRKGVFEKWMGDEVEQQGVRSLEIDDEKGVSRELGEGSGSGRVGEGASNNGMSNVEYERLEAEDNHSLSGAVDDPYALNTVYTSFRLSPKREVADDHQGSDSQNEDDHGSETGSDVNEEDDDEENSSDSESDADESSSPDASMTDIMPLLDELHPLLDEDAPQQAQGGTSSAAQRSVDASSIESGEDSENHEDDDGEDDNEEDAHSNKGKGDKPEITWTEDDQKNLMDMGTSELERNQRLENLIARRRARKMMRLADEKNLIDLESTDLPFNVPHISTLRRNPFDSPVDSYDAMGLPPIPGSAPSILQPRRNPFDLPYDQNEEKPILTGDSFAQEFIPPQRDALFRRYESFSVGPVNGGTSRQDMRRRPYFVPERTAVEEAYASIQRQLSEVSESKASSVPETDSVSSASDDEDQNITEPDTLKETIMVSKDEQDSDHAEYESQSSEDAESLTVEHSNMDVNQNEFQIQLGGSESLHEARTHTALIEESSSHVESGQSEINMRLHAIDENSDRSSHSSPTVEMQDEIRMEMGYINDDFRQVETDFSGSVETARSEMHLPIEQIEHGSDSSSVTSLSETNEEVSDTVGRMEIIDETRDSIEDEYHSVIHSPVGESSVNLKLEIPDDHHIQEPVYDSSPTPVDRVLLFSSASVDRQPESSQLSDSSHLSTGSENKQGKEPSYEDENHQHEHVQLHYEETPTDVGQTSISKSSSTPPHQSITEDATLLAAVGDHPHLEVEHVSEIDGGSSSSDTDSSEENSVDHSEEKDVLQVEHVEVQSSIQIDRDVVVVQDLNVGPHASSDSDSEEDQVDTRTIEVVRDELPVPSSDDDNDNINPEQVTSNQYADSEGHSHSSTGADQKQLHETPTPNSTFDQSQEIMDSTSTVELESLKKTSTDDTSSRVIPEVSVAIPLKNRLIESIKGMSAGGAPFDKQDEFQTPVSARYFDFTSEGFQPNASGIEGAEDEIEEFKELDEGMLAELDTVGDFSVPNIEASTVEDAGMTFQHIDNEVPVEEVILPSLLFGGGAAILPENEDSKDVPTSEPDSPFSDTKDASPENEDSKDVPTSEPDSPFSDTKDVSPENEDSKDVPTSEPVSLFSDTKDVSPENELVTSSTDVVKSETVPTSSVSSPKRGALEKTEMEPPGTSSSPNTELQKGGFDCPELEQAESPKLSPEGTQATSPSKKEKSHDSSSSSSSSDSDSDSD